MHNGVSGLPQDQEMVGNSGENSMKAERSRLFLIEGAARLQDVVKQILPLGRDTAL